MAALAFAAGRVAVTFAVAPKRPTVGLVSPDIASPGPQVSMPATVPGMPRDDGRLTFEERARAGGEAAAARLTEEQRKERARKAAQGAHGPLATVRKLAAGWAKLSDEERAEMLPAIRAELRKAGIIR